MAEDVKRGDSNQHDDDDRLSRRRFIAAGAAFGGAIVWSPAGLAQNFGAAAPTCEGRIKALKKRTLPGHGSHPAVRHEAVDILDDALAKIGTKAGPCADLQKYIDFVQDHTPSTFPTSESNKLVNRALKAMELCGCFGGPTGPTGPTGDA